MLTRVGSAGWRTAGGLVTAGSIISFAFIGTAFAAASIYMPKADGSYSSWTPSTGTAHWSLVDEAACNGTTDYVSTSVVGNRDSYVVSTTSIPTGAVITKVDIVPCASRASSGNGSSQLNVFYRFAGTNSADTGAYALPTGTTPAQLATTTFSGLSLMQGASTAFEVGAVYSSGTKGVRLSRIASMVTYTAAPTGLTAISTTTSSIVISWTDASDNETGFSIERSLDGSSWGVIASTSPNATSYADTGLSAGTTYYYRVRAAAGSAYTAYTNSANATTVAGTSPSAPSGLGLTKFSGTTTTDILLNWTDNSSDESGFAIERMVNFGGFVGYATTTASTTSYTDFGLTGTSTYTYRVRAFNGYGYSAYTNMASTTLP